MDEPCSALDPIATTRIEDLMHELKKDYTIVIVTHNMQQAARVADVTAFFSVDVREDGGRHGILVEQGPTTTIFTNPSDKRTEDYVTGGSVDDGGVEFQASLHSLEAGARSRVPSSCERFVARSTSSVRRTSSLRRGRGLRRRDRRALPPDREVG